MDSISNDSSNFSEELDHIQSSEIKKFIDIRYYRRFYLDESSSVEDAVKDFVVRGWKLGHNLNPLLHTKFVRTYYSDQVRSLSDFIELIKRPVFLNALCSQEINLQKLRRDIQSSNKDYSYFSQFFSFDVESYCLSQIDIDQNNHFESILYHLFFIGLSQNRLRKFGYLKALHFDRESTDLDCIVSQDKPFCLNKNHHYAGLLSDVFDLAYYRSKHNLDLYGRDEIIDHFCKIGWIQNLDPHPCLHLKFIKHFYGLSCNNSGFDEFTKMVQKKFIPNALVKRSVNFSEFIKCIDSFDIERQSQLLSIDVARFTCNHYKRIRSAKMTALKHLYLFGLDENTLSDQGFFKDFFLPRFPGMSDYEFLVSQTQPLDCDVADLGSTAKASNKLKLPTRLVVGVVLFCNTLSEINRLLNSLVRNLTGEFSQVSLVFYDNSPNEHRLDLASLNHELMSDLDCDIIYDSDNCGFSVAHNRLMESCFSRPDSLYLGLNPDGYLLPNSLQQCYAFLESKNKSFLCEINTEPMAHPKWYHPHTGLTDWVSGVAFFVDESAFAVLKGFDPDFPLYCEDVDLSFRAYECGVSLYVTPFFGFFHDTTERLYQQETNEWRSVKSLIGEWYLCKKWGNLDRALDLKKLMISRRIDLDHLPKPPSTRSQVHDLVYHLVRSPRYSRSVY